MPVLRILIKEIQQPCMLGSTLLELLQKTASDPHKCYRLCACSRHMLVHAGTLHRYTGVYAGTHYICVLAIFLEVFTYVRYIADDHQLKFTPKSSIILLAF